MNLRKQTIIAFTFKIVIAFTAFGYNWILSRLLGAEGFGSFQIALTISMIGSIVAGLGLNNAVLRLVSANIAIKNYGLAKGFYKKAFLFVGMMSLFLTIIIQLSTKPIFFLFFPQQEALVPLIIVISWAIIPLAFNNLLSELLKVFSKFQLSLFVQSGFYIVFATIGLLLSWLIMDAVTALQAIFVFIAALWLTFLLSIYFFIKYKPLILRDAIEINYKDKELLASAMPLWTIALASIAMNYLDILIIGMWVGAKEAGIYAIAKKVAGLNSYLLISTNTIVAPQFAILYAQNKMEELKKLAQKATKTLFWSGLAALCFFTFFSKPILSLFGTAFTEGALLLIILSIGQFINVATGSVGALLVMTGYESLFRTNMILSSLLTVILYLALIPSFSTIGVSIATALGMAFLNIRTAWLANRMLGFYVF